MRCKWITLGLFVLLVSWVYVHVSPIYFAPFHSPFHLYDRVPGGGDGSYAPQQWTFCNFDRVMCCNGTQHFPRTVHEVSLIVKAAAASGHKIRVVGAGHSMSRLVCDADNAEAPLTLLSLDKLQRFISFDRTSMTVTAEAGLRLKNFNKALAGVGLQLYNMGLIDEQSLAGLTATGVHGTGIAFPSVSNAVVSMDVVLANGTLVTFNATSHSNIFKHSRLHLGVFGVVVRLTFKVRDAIHLVRRHRYVPLESALDSMDSKIDSQRNFQFWWVTYTGVALLNEIDEATEKEATELALSPIRAWVDKVMTDTAFLLMMAFGTAFPHQAYVLFYLLPYLMPERDFSGPSWQMLTFPGINYHTVRYTEMEYFVDRKLALHAIRASEAFTNANRERCPVNAFHPIRTIKGDDIPLSPMYQRDSVSISFVMVDRPEFEDCAALLEQRLLAFGGRPHWGKRHTLSRQQVDSIYGSANVADFRAVVNSVDPQGVFRTKYLVNLFGL